MSLIYKTLEAVRSQQSWVAICEVQLAGAGGFEVLERIKKSEPNLPVIVDASGAPVATAIGAAMRAAIQHVEKPLVIWGPREFANRAVADVQRGRKPTRQPRSAPVALGVELMHDRLRVTSSTSAP